MPLLSFDGQEWLNRTYISAGWCCQAREMEQMNKHWIVTALVTGLLVLGAAFPPQSTAMDESDLEALNLILFSESIALPDVSLPDVDRRPVRLLSFRDRVVILNFWTTWCHYCERERAALEALFQKYKGDGLAILAVNLGESEDQVIAYVARHGLSFPHLMDPGAKAEEAFGIQATPTNFLVDRRGHVVAGGMGYRDWNGPQAHRIIESLLAAEDESLR